MAALRLGFCVGPPWLVDDLFRVAAHDPGAWLLAILALGAVAALACALPARRAARLSPRLAMEGSV